jgi:diguanylate cyclase (GGDEF)-like protein
MIDTSEILEAYLDGVLRLSGARCVSLYLAPMVGSGGEQRLLHVGEGEPVPELRDEDVALKFASGAAKKITSDGHVDADSAVRAVPSAAEDGVLVPLSLTSPLIRKGERSPDAPERRASPVDAVPPGWLGLRLESSEARSAIEGDLRRALVDASENPRLAELRQWVIGLGENLASYHIRLSTVIWDRIAGLPGRADFQSVLTEEMARVSSRNSGLTLAFVNPDDFGSINERFDREAGDLVIREIAERLIAMTRRGDYVARFGGAIFAVVFVNTAADQAPNLGKQLRVRLTDADYLDGALRLRFSVGVSWFDPSDAGLRDPHELIRRTDQALAAAKLAGGNVDTMWSPGSDGEQPASLDRLSGVFTGNMSRDYRNMAMLWEVLGAIASNLELETLTDQVLETLFVTIKPSRLALFTSSGADAPTPSVVLRRRQNAGHSPEREEGFQVDPEIAPLLTTALRDRVAITEESVVVDGEARLVCVVPLLLEDEELGCLYLDGRPKELVLDASDTVFLQALATQLAVALDRARLSQREKTRRENEQRQLRAELKELRSAIQHARLVYRSAEMEELLSTVRRVAPTEATILITGDSGTGKELLARTIHELSGRREGKMVVVDCGSIPPSLVESELFGHEKGAYTGAARRAKGRFEEAQGGTVLLDEISELPLEVQSRLLRFVQEKELVRVGGTRSQRLDVRILAASNRSLEDEVAAGRFREDLFYRINVVRLVLPPLRQRPDDILDIARHYLETFSVTYQKNIRRMTPDAEKLLVDHLWPGNVRELQNLMMRAVILCDGERLDGDDLKPLIEAGTVATEPQDRSAAMPVGEPRIAETPPPSDKGASSSEVASWNELRDLVAREIEVALAEGAEVARPLGKWLGEDLIREAHAAAGGVARRAAPTLGLAESTFGRRLRKAEAREASGLMTRTPSWREVRSLLTQMLGSWDFEVSGPLLDRVQGVLLEEIVDQVGGDVDKGSALLGVSPPTYRLRVAELTAS